MGNETIFRLHIDLPYAKNYGNRTLTVKVIVENVVTCFFGTRCMYFHTPAPVLPCRCGQNRCRCVSMCADAVDAVISHTQFPYTVRHNAVWRFSSRLSKSCNTLVRTVDKFCVALADR